jgi:hypothetical protein
MRVVHVLLRCMVAGLSLALLRGGEARVRSLSGAVSGAVSSASADRSGSRPQSSTSRTRVPRARPASAASATRTTTAPISPRSSSGSPSPARGSDPGLQLAGRHERPSPHPSGEGGLERLEADTARLRATVLVSSSPALRSPWVAVISRNLGGLPGGAPRGDRRRAVRTGERSRRSASPAPMIRRGRREGERRARRRARRCAPRSPASRSGYGCGGRRGRPAAAAPPRLTQR